MVRWLILVLFVLSEAGTALARPDTTATRRVIPVEAYAQFAGGQGMWSCGAIVSPLNRLSISLGVGYTPPAYGGIVTFTSKLLYTLWSIRLDERYTLLPLRAGIHGTLSLSEEIRVGWDKQTYPRDYYWWPASIRKGPVFQCGLQWKLRRYLITPYLEASTNDLYLVSYWENRRTIPVSDIVVLGAGVSVRLNP